MKKTLLLPLDLQLFAGEVEGPDGEQYSVEDDNKEEVVVDDDDVTFEDESDDDETEESTDDQDDQAGKPEDQQTKEPNDTAKAVIAERKKWQERLKALEKKSSLADKLMKSVGVEDLDALHAQLDAAEAAKLTKVGMDPKLAESIVRQQREIEDMKQTLRAQKFDVEADRLKQDPFFADIDDYRDEYEELAMKSGQSLEDIYMMKRGRVRMKEMEREIEQRVKLSNDKKQSKRVDTTTSGEGKKAPKVNLSPEQLEMAKLAVRQGTFKSVEEYAKYAK